MEIYTNKTSDYTTITFNITQEFKDNNLIIIIIDSSYSMNTKLSSDAETDGLIRLDLIKHSIKNMIELSNEKVMLEIVKLSTCADIVFDVNYMNYHNKKRTSKALNTIYPDANTCINKLQFNDYNQSGGCFTGNSKINIIRNKREMFVNVEELEITDLVLSKNKTPSKIKYIVKLILNRNTAICKLNDNLQITPNHPIKYCNYWIHPVRIIPINYIYLDYIYNLVLESNHVVNIGNYDVITLGHNMTDNNVVIHDFYGTNKVVEKLDKCSNVDGIITIPENNLYL